MDIMELIRKFPHDPYAVLKITENSSDSELERAFEESGKDETASWAYKLVKNGESRTLYGILSPKPLSG